MLRQQKNEKSANPLELYSFQFPTLLLLSGWSVRRHEDLSLTYSHLVLQAQLDIVQVCKCLILESQLQCAFCHLCDSC